MLPILNIQEDVCPLNSQALKFDRLTVFSHSFDNNLKNLL